jgi:uncharacterized protein YbjQ (UPF0145 family)
MLTYCLASSLPSKPKLCENARGEDFELMLQHAAALGANALIGVRYDANDVTDGVTSYLTVFKNEQFKGFLGGLI